MQIGATTLQAYQMPLLDGAARLAKSSELKSDSLAGAAGASGLAGSKLTAQAPQFTNFLERAVSEVNDKMGAAEVEKTKVFTGETGNLHQAMISMQEASVSFSLMVEVRNKLVESYQELMRMQV